MNVLIVLSKHLTYAKAVIQVSRLSLDSETTATVINV